MNWARISGVYDDNNNKIKKEMNCWAVKFIICNYLKYNNFYPNTLKEISVYEVLMRSFLSNREICVALTSV